MPNIIFTSYCNLNCPYCFAQQMIEEQDGNRLTVQQLQHILNWLAKSPNEIGHIGIIGGEPTLHPDFTLLVNLINDFCIKYNKHSILFTNGILLSKLMDQLPSRMSILLNLNDPKAMNEAAWQGIERSLKKASMMGWLHSNSPQGAKIILGCNVCEEIDDYSFFWDIVKKYKITTVRMSITAPVKEEYKLNKHKYFEDMYPKFIKFCEDAYQANSFIQFDCGYIPDCYLTNKDIRLLSRVTSSGSRKKTLCQPVIDITPNFFATGCFGVTDFIDCSDFPTLVDLQNYILYTKNVPKTLNNNQGKCKDCKQHKLLQCQGGCLGFSS